MARRVRMALVRQGLSMRSDSVVRLKHEWPGWTPTANMLRTKPEVYSLFRCSVEGGLSSPLGEQGRETGPCLHVLRAFLTTRAMKLSLTIPK